MCGPFEEKSEAYIVIADNYIIEARVALGESDEVAREIMKKFAKWKDMSAMFNEGGKCWGWGSFVIGVECGYAPNDCSTPDYFIAC